MTVVAAAGTGTGTGGAGSAEVRAKATAASASASAFDGWRSPTPAQETPLVEAASLPGSTTKPQANGDSPIPGLTNKLANGSIANHPMQNHNQAQARANHDQDQDQRKPNGKVDTNAHSNGTSTSTSIGQTTAGATAGGGHKNLHPSLHYPSFQSPCEHSADGDMHSHAVDLLSFSKLTHPPPPTTGIHTMHPLYRSPGSVPPSSNANGTAGVAASVPANTSSFLAAPRPTSSGSQNGIGAHALPQPQPQPPRAARRMSSSTSQSRGKSGFLGATNPTPTKDARPSGLPHSSSYNGPNPPHQRRLSNSATPQLYDFSKTDRPTHPGAGSSMMGSRTISTPAGGVAASLPVRGPLHDRLAQANALALQNPSAEDMELDMQFGGSDDDDRAGSGRSGSADFDMEMEVDESGEVITQALGTGSGGVKGRRKGETFDCEYCGKTYRHPSCLSKHRWEHSPHWKEPTAANMSKHQQVQTLEAAAILTMGLSLPKDKSLWPSVVSNSGPNGHGHRRNSRDPSAARSPPSSVLAPLTPSSLREPSSLGAMSERMGKERKSSPGSDDTTSSMGAGEPYPSAVNGGLGIRTHPTPPQHHVNLHPSMGQRHPSFTRRASRTPSFSNSPGHPNSLPDMAGLHFHHQSAPSASHGVSPIPNRGMPLSLQTRTGMIGGGMFGNQINTSVRNSSVRSGADDLPEEDDDEDEDDVAAAHGHGHRAKSSSEEAEEARKAREGEEWGMAEEMEL